MYYRDSLRGENGTISISINGTELYYQNCTSYFYAYSNIFTYHVKKDDVIEINPIGAGSTVLVTLRVYHYEED